MNGPRPISEILTLNAALRDVSAVGGLISTSLTSMTAELANELATLGTNGRCEIPFALKLMLAGSASEGELEVRLNCALAGTDDDKDEEDAETEPRVTESACANTILYDG